MHNKIKISSADLLNKIFNILLINGATPTISETDFYHIIEKLISDFSSKEFSERFGDITLDIENSDFNKVVENANIKADNIDKPGICIEKVNGVLTAYATYDKKYIDLAEFPTSFVVVSKALEEVIKPYVKTEIIEKYDFNIFSKTNITISKNVAAFLVDYLIKRYLEDMIEKGRWPVQCKDIDEYVFRKNLGGIINEKGTNDVFLRAYIHYTYVICMLLGSERKIQISNNIHNILAYSNLVKILKNNKLEFLQNYLKPTINGMSFWINISSKGAFGKSRNIIENDICNKQDHFINGEITDEYFKLMKKRFELCNMNGDLNYNF